MGWFGISVQSGQHHDAAAGHWHRRDERHSNSQPLRRGTDAGILARSTGKAVLVSGLTAIAGFGSLILAKHRGIHSLGCVMAVGITTCMIAGLTFLPALLNLLGRWRPLIKQPSADKTVADTGSGGTEVKTSIVLKS
jgi:uncharacterized membrane protein YdfJ with MMPL/SSD domain